MKIENDSLISNSIKDFFNNSSNYNYPINNLISPALDIQKHQLERFGADDPDYMIVAFTLIGNTRTLSAGMLKMISSGNQFCINVFMRSLFENFVILFFMLSRDTEADKDKIAKQLILKDFRKTVFIHFENLFLYNKPTLIEKEQAIESLDISKKKKIWYTLNLLKDLEEKSGQSMEMENILECFTSAQYRKKSMDSFSKPSVLQTCEDIDQIINADPNSFPFYFHDYFQTLYLLLFRQCSNFTHPTLFGAGKFCSENFHEAFFRADYDLLRDIAQMVEILIFQNWTINKYLKLGMDSEIEKLLGEFEEHREKIKVLLRSTNS